jgi:hypothetical protein
MRSEDTSQTAMLAGSEPIKRGGNLNNIRHKTFHEQKEHMKDNKFAAHSKNKNVTDLY